MTLLICLLAIAKYVSEADPVSATPQDTCNTYSDRKNYLLSKYVPLS